jgi:hypothetical protein
MSQLNRPRQLGRWFRFYEEALNDPAIQLLPERLFRAWINCLCLASRHGGKLPDTHAIAFALRIDAQEAGEIVSALIDARLLVADMTRAGVVTPSDWASRQYASDHDKSSDRVRKFRARKRSNPKGETTRNAFRNGSVTLTEEEVEEEYRCRGKNTNPVSRLVSSSTTEQEARGSESRIQHTHDTITDDGEVVS